MCRQSQVWSAGRSWALPSQRHRIARAGGERTATARRGVGGLNSALARSWELADAQLELFELTDGRRELRTERIFFDEPILRVLEGEQEAALEGVFTYFVNALRAGERSTPYSMVRNRRGDRP